jgi:hypothetical protein
MTAAQPAHAADHARRARARLLIPTPTNPFSTRPMSSPCRPMARRHAPPAIPTFRTRWKWRASSPI